MEGHRRSWWLAVVVVALAAGAAGQGTVLDGIKEQLEHTRTSLDDLMGVVDPTTTIKPPTTSTKPPAPSTTSTEPPEPSTTSTDQSEPSTTSTDQPEPPTTSTDQSEPSTTSTNQSEPSTTSTDQSEPSTTSTDQPEPPPIHIPTAAAPKLPILPIKPHRRRLLQSETKTTETSSTDVPQPQICTVQSGPDDLCTRLITVLDDIDDVTKQISDGQMENEQLQDLKAANGRLDKVVNDTKATPNFISGVDVTLLKERKNELDNVVTSAEDVVQKAIDNQQPEEPDNTLAIVLGVLGGLAGVAIIAFVGFKCYKKKKAKKRQVHVEHIEGQDNQGYN